MCPDSAVAATANVVLPEGTTDVTPPLLTTDVEVEVTTAEVLLEGFLQKKRMARVNEVVIHRAHGKRLANSQLTQTRQKVK